MTDASRLTLGDLTVDAVPLWVPTGSAAWSVGSRNPLQVDVVLGADLLLQFSLARFDIGGGSVRLARHARYERTSAHLTTVPLTPDLPLPLKSGHKTRYRSARCVAISWKSLLLRVRPGRQTSTSSPEP